MIGMFAAAAVLALAGAPQPRALVVTETAGFHHPRAVGARAAAAAARSGSSDIAAPMGLPAIALRHEEHAVRLTPESRSRPKALNGCVLDRLEWHRHPS
jgi:hypothetical protein